MKFDDEFITLINEIREYRAQMSNCPSAKEGVDVTTIITEFCDNDFYKEDYQAITSYFAADYVSYEDVVKNILGILELKMF